MDNIKHLKDRVIVELGDINNINLNNIFEGCDYVLHQAALPSVPRSIKDPIKSNETNVTGTLKVLKAASDSNVKKVVFASSSSVYGDTPKYLLFTEILLNYPKLKICPLTQNPPMQSPKQQEKCTVMSLKKYTIFKQ